MIFFCLITIDKIFDLKVISLWSFTGIFNLFIILNFETIYSLLLN